MFYNVCINHEENHKMWKNKRKRKKEKTRKRYTFPWKTEFSRAFFLLRGMLKQDLVKYSRDSGYLSPF